MIDEKITSNNTETFAFFCRNYPELFSSVHAKTSLWIQKSKKVFCFRLFFQEASLINKNRKWGGILWNQLILRGLLDSSDES